MYELHTDIWHIRFVTHEGQRPYWHVTICKETDEWYTTDDQKRRIYKTIEVNHESVK